jgi:hypothetical protein
MYEVWFSMIYNRKTSNAYWIRITSLIPKKNETNLQKEQLILWIGRFSSKNSTKNKMVKRMFDLQEFKFGIKEQIISSSIGSMGVSHSRFNFILSDGSQYGWDLRYSRFKEPYYHVPTMAKMLGIITTIPITSHPNIQITGSITFDGETQILEDAIGTQTHIIGKKYSNEWAWVHCNSFEGYEDAFLEVSCTAGRCTFGFHDGLNEFLFNTPLEVIRTKAKYSQTSLEFSGENTRFLIKGYIEVPLKDLIAIEYLGPQSERIICYNSELANCTIEVYKKRLKEKSEKKDKPIFKAYSKQGCAFETTHFYPIENGPRILKWEEEKLKKEKSN